VSTYKKEVGTAVQNAAGTLSGVVEGQLWYDSSAFVWKYNILIQLQLGLGQLVII